MKLSAEAEEVKKDFARFLHRVNSMRHIKVENFNLRVSCFINQLKKLGVEIDTLKHDGKQYIHYINSVRNNLMKHRISLENRTIIIHNNGRNGIDTFR